LLHLVGFISLLRRYRTCLVLESSFFESYSVCTGRWRRHAVSLAFPELDSQWV